MLIRSLLNKKKKRRLSRKGYVNAWKRRTAAREIRTSPRNRKHLIYLISLLVICSAAVVTVSIVYKRDFIPQPYVKGQRSPRTIYSEAPFDFVNRERMQADRERAKRDVPFIYQVDSQMVTNGIASLMDIQDAVREMRAAQSAEQRLSPADYVAQAENEAGVTDILNIVIDKGVFEDLAEIFTSKSKTETLADIITEIAGEGIRSEETGDTFLSGMTPDDEVVVTTPDNEREIKRIGEIASPTAAVAEILDRYKQEYPRVKKRHLEALTVVLQRMIKPNLSYDPDATNTARESAAVNVPAARERVQRGVPLVRRGEKIGTNELLKLQMHAAKVHSMQDEKIAPRQVGVYAVLALIIVLTCACGLYFIAGCQLADKAVLTLVFFVFILQVVVSRLTMDFYYLNYDASIFLYALIPYALGALLLVQLVSTPVALWITIFTAAVSAFQGFEVYQIAVVGCVAAFAATVFARRARTRFQFLRTGLVIAGAVLIVNVLFAVKTEMPLDILPRLSIYSLINGLATAIIAASFLPVMEFIFGITTDISLLELSDRNHPLLKKLQLVAPGTYHHSLVVATLAEQAATAVGANPLLARVCAYFHDIGKISQPEYFIENLGTSGSDNPHKKLEPRMSTLVLLNHVKGGLEMARKNKLKKVIREAIAQHHGSSLIQYFYERAQNKAKTAEQKEGIDQQDYRYPGPRPVRKEIALVSIADACEAASRCLEKPTPQKIEAMVKKIIMTRIQDGQLDNAALTFKEVAVTRDVMIKTLANMLHPRIQYDEQVSDEG
ncbi:MAG: HD family phosphohydrolase [Verrucomicrobiota bacterium]